jgi:ferric-dicitrate binding protein FerR (iron transport regulator)
MNTIDTEKPDRGDDAVEQLLARAEPRPAPDPASAEQARLAVLREWQTLTRKRRRWRSVVAIAATLAALAVLSLQVMPPEPALQLAAVNKIAGDASEIAEDGTLSAFQADRFIKEGQTIKTGKNSGIGLQWHSGGSLRMDENTTVHFMGTDAIELRHGRVYFDSESVTQHFVVHTSLGDVYHLGTQYMADVSGTDMLRVSVREGRVSIDGVYHSASAREGEQILLHGSRGPQVTSINNTGPEWHWVESVAPRLDTEGKTFYELLQWVSRETGLRYRFSDEDAEIAAGAYLSGVDGDEPLALLRVGAVAARLKIEQSDGVLVVSTLDP